MIFRTEAATDIAMLGIWDAEVPTDDIGATGHKAFQKAIEEDARHGKLIFINTSCDGSFSILITSDCNELPLGLEKWYMAIDKSLYLNATCGRVTVGGLEDYRSTTPQITSESDIFEVKPGTYKLLAYQLKDDEEGMAEEIRQRVGHEEFDYYSSRPTGCFVALLLVLAGLVGAFFWSWLLLAAAAALGFGYAALRSHLNSKDQRYMAVQKAFDDWQAAHPMIACLLEEVGDMQPSDGCFDLEHESA